MDEIMFEGKPVLFTLEGLAEGNDGEARRYSEEIWNWVLASFGDGVIKNQKT